MLLTKSMNKSVVAIIKNNHMGDEVWRYSGKIIAESLKGIIAEAYFNRSDLEFNGILLKEGDRFLELYLFGKWFNIFEVYDRDSSLLKAWYCNVTRPVRVTDHIIAYDDLALDLLVFPDKRQLALDEDEFIMLDLDNDDQRHARLALKELQNLFSRNEKIKIRDLI